MADRRYSDPIISERKNKGFQAIVQYTDSVVTSEGLYVMGSIDRTLQATPSGQQGTHVAPLVEDPGDRHDGFGVLLDPVEDGVVAHPQASVFTAQGTGGTIDRLPVRHLREGLRA